MNKLLRFFTNMFSQKNIPTIPKDFDPIIESLKEIGIHIKIPDDFIKNLEANPKVTDVYLEHLKKDHPPYVLEEIAHFLRHSIIPVSHDLLAILGKMNDKDTVWRLGCTILEETKKIKNKLSPEEIKSTTKEKNYNRSVSCLIELLYKRNGGKEVNFFIIAIDKGDDFIKTHAIKALGMSKCVKSMEDVNTIINIIKPYTTSLNSGLKSTAKATLKKLEAVL